MDNEQENDQDDILNLEIVVESPPDEMDNQREINTFIEPCTPTKLEVASWVQLLMYSPSAQKKRTTKS